MGETSGNSHSEAALEVPRFLGGKMHLAGACIPDAGPGAMDVSRGAVLGTSQRKQGLR